MGFLKSIFRKDETDDAHENINRLASDAATDIIRQLSGANISKSKRVIDNLVAITNASGGTGASTIASNVAYMLDKKGFKVLVVDLNILYPIQHTYFGLKQQLEKPDLAGYLLGKNSLGDGVDTTGKISVLYSNNRSLMDSINCESDVAITNFTDAIDKLRGLFDVVILDVPMKIDHTLANTAFYIADQIYLVWDEGISSISNTERIRRNMAVSGIDSYTKMSVILNKKTNIHYTNYPFQKLNMELAQVLPFETAIIESSLRSVVFCHKGISKTKNSEAFYNGIEDLADKILKDGGYVG